MGSRQRCFSVWGAMDVAELRSCVSFIIMLSFLDMGSHHTSMPPFTDISCLRKKGKDGTDGIGLETRF